MLTPRRVTIASTLFFEVVIPDLEGWRHRAMLKRYISLSVSKQSDCLNAEVRTDRPARIKGLVQQPGAL